MRRLCVTASRHPDPDPARLQRLPTAKFTDVNTDAIRLAAQASNSVCASGLRVGASRERWTGVALGALLSTVGAPDVNLGAQSNTAARNLQRACEVSWLIRPLRETLRRPPLRIAAARLRAAARVVDDRHRLSNAVRRRQRPGEKRHAAKRCQALKTNKSRNSFAHHARALCRSRYKF